MLEILWPPLTVQGKIGHVAAQHTFHIRYRSWQKLDADQTPYIAAAAIYLPPVHPPPGLNQSVSLCLELPDGQNFDVEGRTIQALPEGALIVAPADPARARDRLKAALDAHQGAQDGAEPHDVTVTTPAPQTAPPTTIPAPEPGKSYPVVKVQYQQVGRFAPDARDFLKTAVFKAPLENTQLPLDAPACLLIALPDDIEFRMNGLVLSKDEHNVTIRVNPRDREFQKACAFPGTTQGQQMQAQESPNELHEPSAQSLDENARSEADRARPLRWRIGRMSMDDKINLALSGNREERMALALDGNKAIHAYLLKNNKISIDEIILMARHSSLNPDVLKQIAEHAKFGRNPNVVKNLVHNPRTPIVIATRLLDRLTKRDIEAIAKKSSLRAQLVTAAKRKTQKGRG